MRLSNRVDTSTPRDWEITMKSFQQYRIDYLERLVRGHICLWPEGSQEVKHLSWKQGWGKYKFSPVVLVFAVTITCRDISSEGEGCVLKELLWHSGHMRSRVNTAKAKRLKFTTIWKECWQQHWLWDICFELAVVVDCQCSYESISCRCSKFKKAFWRWCWK